MRITQTEDALDAKSIIMVGVGSAGCRIAAQLQGLLPEIGTFAHVSCDEEDLNRRSEGIHLLLSVDRHQPRSPSTIRAIGEKHLEELRGLLEGASTVFVVAGLGGAVGSALAPLVAQVGQEMGARVIGIAIMPYRFEKRRLFYAGLALRRLRTYTSGVIIIDNDELLNESLRTPISELYPQVNRKISWAIGTIMASVGKEDFGLGLHKFTNTIEPDGYSILSVESSESFNRAEEAVMATVQSIYRVANPDQVSKAILFIAGDQKLSLGEVSSSMNVVGSILGRGALQLEYGMSTSGTSTLTAILLASGFKSTKFDGYDPLSSVLMGKELDFAPESSSELALDGLVQLEC